MHDLTSRREFLRTLGAAGIFLSSPSVLNAALNGAGQRGDLLAGIHIIEGTALGGENNRSRTWIYLREVLARAGLFFETHAPGQIEKICRRGHAIIVLAGNLYLKAREREALTEWVKSGGALLGIGGASGLKELFGISSETSFADGWIKPTSTAHPILSGLRSSLHVFGGYSVTPSKGTALAGVQGGSVYVKGQGIVENKFGQGRTLLLGPDLVFSIVHIQQGTPVLQDAKPPADGSAVVNDGVLKAEDGNVLDWERDRSAVDPEGQIFLEPVTDELREVLVRSILHLACEQGLSVPLLWQWPRALKGIATMSHDSDGNDPAKAVALLDVVNRCQLKTTWCILYPGGYPKDFYRKLQDQGYETALHYDAMTGAEKTSWSKANFLMQHQWLLKEAGLEEIIINKNHYTRWEGRLEFWHWCEEAGFRVDQTRGPSKKGTIGFPLGGSQPYFPLDDEAARPRFLDVLEVNLLSQDLVITCPPEYGKQLADSAFRHHGVAHFLFHPAHIQKPGVAEALSGLVDYARSLGMEWWTSEQIVQWERARRGVAGKKDAERLDVRCPKGLDEATLLFLRPDSRQVAVEIDGNRVATSEWKLFGFEFDAVETPLRGEMRVRCGVT